MTGRICGGLCWAWGERSEAKLPSPISAFAGIVGREQYPVEKKSAEILKRLIAKGAQRLKSLFRGNRSRSEVVATFLSILELCKLRSVRVTRPPPSIRSKL